MNNHRRPRIRPSFFRLLCVLVAMVTATTPGLAGVVMNEVYYNPAERGASLEFIEIFNDGASEIDIGYWHIDDAVEFSFPEGTILSAGQFAVIAGNPEALRSKWNLSAYGPWRGKLSNKGESITLRDADGKKIDEIDYEAGFPWPASAAGAGASMELIHPSLNNTLGGNWRPSAPPASTEKTTYFVTAAESDWLFFKGMSEPAVEVGAWRQIEFADEKTWSKGRAPLGYGDNDDNTLLQDMENGYSTVYLRKSFSVDTPAVPEHVRLRVYSDDGAIVWINGIEVARLRASRGEPSHRMTAAPNHEAAWDEITISNAPQILRPGQNVIAIMGLNGSPDSSDFSIDAELLTLPAAETPPKPSPGRQNISFAHHAPPTVNKVTHSPASPRPGESVVVQVELSDAESVATVFLETQAVDPGDYISSENSRYRSNWNRIPMGASENGRYETTVGGSLQTHRRLVRYRIIVEDDSGARTAVPYPDDPQRNFAWFCYGKMPAWTGSERPGRAAPKTFSAELMRSMPAVHLIAADREITNSQYNGRFNEQFLPGTVVYQGKVYDHIRFRNRGETTTYMTGKNKWRINFNRGHELEPPIDYQHTMQKPWRRLNLNPGTVPYNRVFRGNASLHERIGMRVHQLAGLPASDTCYLQLRVIDGESETGSTQYDGDVWGLYMGFEAIDGRFLDNHGLPDGELHKIAQSGTIEKRSSPDGSAGDEFHGLMNAMRRRQSEAWWRQHIDIDHYASYHAVSIAVARHDQKLNHNYSLFRHPDRGWMPLPWDLDMCLWPIRYDANSFRWQTLFKYSVLHHQALRLHYQNRAREILDLILATDQVHAAIDELAKPLGNIDGHNFAELDAVLWNYHPMTTSQHRGSFYQNPIRPTHNSEPIQFSANGIEGRIAYFKEYLANTPGPGNSRSGRVHLGWGFRQLARDCQDPHIPDTPKVTLESTNGKMTAICSAFTDPDGGNTFAAQAWRIATVSFPGIPGYLPGAPIQLEADALWQSKSIEYSETIGIPTTELLPGRSYRMRARFADNTGRWGHWSPPITFVAPQPDLSHLQSLTISEIMYHPRPPSPDERQVSPFSADYEFIEISNRGPHAVPLADLRITNGVEFSFATSAWDTLPAGEQLVIVRNQRAFSARYPNPDTKIAGAWGSGKLSDNGETVALSHGWHSVLHQVEYDDKGAEWPQEADGTGASLQFDGVAWSASESDGGSPGVDSH